MEGPDYKDDGLTPYSTCSTVHTGQCKHNGMDACHRIGRWCYEGFGEFHDNNATDGDAEVLIKH
jgi:hypothetical protein